MTRLEWLTKKHETVGSPSRFGSQKRQTGLRSVLAYVRQKENFEIDIFAEVPKTLKPCGFTGDTLTEGIWLPYRNSNQPAQVVMRPSVIVTKKDCAPRIIDFLSDTHSIRGTFPSQELETLPSAWVAQNKENKEIQPCQVDSKIEEALKKHLDIPRAEMILAKRWIEGTFFYDVFDAFPIESILGVSESGKSRLCLVNLALAYHAEGLIDPTEATIFRAKEEDRVSLIVDEAEYLNNVNLHATLRILINASYSKNSGFVTRYDEEDGRRVKRRFNLYSPMCISGIGGLEGVTLSRAFRIVMRRRDKDFPKAYPQDYQNLRDQLYVLRIRDCFDVYDLYQKMDISNIVSARFEELFKPLFCMTKFFGNDDEWAILAEWCKEYQANFRIEALNVASEEMILVSLSKIAPTPNQPDWFELKELTSIINAQYNNKISGKTISNILYRLGITKRKKVHGLTLIYASKELLETCASSIGIDITDISSSEIATNATNATAVDIDGQPEPWAP
jgi:hypothetical protein